MEDDARQRLCGADSDDDSIDDDEGVDEELSLPHQSVLPARSSETPGDAWEVFSRHVGIESQHRPTYRHVIVLVCVAGLIAALVQGLARWNERRSDASAQPQFPALPRRLVAELYTFGAPGATVGVLSDEASDDGCIPGLRVYSRSERPGFSGNVPVSDPVSWITSQFNFSHAKMDALQALDLNVKENPIHPCEARKSDPPQDGDWWIGGHHAYGGILKAHTDFLEFDAQASPSASVDLVLGAVQERLRKAYLMSEFSFMIYSTDPQKLDVHALDRGWTLVGWARCNAVTRHPFSPRFHDHVALYQDGKTLQCALAFEGTDMSDKSDWLMDADIKADRFCGLGRVHQGFKDKLMRMLSSTDYQRMIKANLPMCAGIVVTGHSLGGAEAELFTACAGRFLKPHEEGFADNQLVTFTPSTPKLLAAFYSEQAPGSLFRSRGSGLCLDVQGVMQAKSEADIVASPCQASDGNWSKDQKWQFAGEGLLVNELSGMCMTGAAIGSDSDGGNALRSVGTPLRQEPCSIAEDQHWDLTKEGFLKSRLTELCVDSKMTLRECPYTDQQWNFTADGHIVNLLSGKCLDVSGSPGTRDGATIVLWPCEYNEKTDQRWEFGDGLLINQLSLKCLTTMVDERGFQNLVLSSCRPEKLSDALGLRWEVMPLGFIRSRHNGKCVNVDGMPGTQAGKYLNLQTCEFREVDAPGLWTMMPEGFIRNRGNDWLEQQKCIRVAGAAGSSDKMLPGVALVLDICETSTDQKWELAASGQIRNTIGGRKCLGVKNLTNSLQLQDCDAGSSQLWQFTSSGLIRNELFRSCIDVSNDEMRHAVLQDCDATLRPDLLWERLL
ncbi:unnamed protein product [Polarella glacialis]|uniref:Ricin B lectin domain-containing protein n=1 Tax=Polarella glacialis TaxID=89957 RepID=A0A813KMH9_POLGL|nr:unnamed protein product [Polarella glacialis]